MGESQQELHIGGLSRRTAVNIETIRYYERVGLLPTPPRTRGRRRIYDDRQVQRLAFIRRSRELGFSLDDIRKLLKLADTDHLDCSRIRAMTAHHLADIRGKIASLKKLERALKVMVDACEPEKKQRSCPILDALSGVA